MSTAAAMSIDRIANHQSRSGAQGAPTAQEYDGN
jgi:hypothetical protein